MHVSITLKAKLCLLMTGLLILTILGVGILFILSERDTLYTLMKNQGEALVNDLAQTSAEPLLNEDDLILNSLVRNASSKRSVEAAFIVDNRGLIRAHSHTEFIGIKFTLPAGLKDAYEAQHQIIAQPFITPTGVPTLYFLRPIFYNNLQLGTAHLELSQDVINTAVREAVHRIIGFLIGAVIFGSIASLGLASWISTPIYNLIEGTKAIAGGNYQYRLPVKSQDEIGTLTQAFNSMAQTLQHKERVEQAFGKYVSGQIAEWILKNPHIYVEGIKQEVTVLFASIRGFTSLAESIPPEQVVELLNRYLTVMTRVIFDFNGLLDKFMGDAIMAVFGAPVLRQENHAEMAVRAALKIQEEIQKLGDQLQREGKKYVGVGIGINSGEVVAGNMGSLERLEYTVLGDNVHIASRLESVAGSGQILITEDVYQNVKNLIDVDQLPPVPIKGRTKPLISYEVKKLKNNG